MNERKVTVAGLFGYMLNLRRGDMIRNYSDMSAEVELPGLGTIEIPSAGTIVLSRKGAHLNGEWTCYAELHDGHVILILSNPEKPEPAEVSQDVVDY